VGEIEPEAGVRLLGALIADGCAQVGVVPMSWERFLKGVAPGDVPPFLERVAPAASAQAGAEEAVGSLAEQLRGASVPERRALVEEFLRSRVAGILGYSDPAGVDEELTLLELGFDSLMAVQLRNRIRTGVGADLPIGRLFDSTSLEALVELLDDQLALSAVSAPRESDVAEQTEVI
jgi:aryl carrier-like protein